MSIDQAVRQVVQEQVAEAITEVVDTKVKEVVTKTDVDAVVDSTVFDEKLADKISDILGEIDPIDYWDHLATDGSVESAIEDKLEGHEHDAYSMWSDIESYASDAIDEAIASHKHDDEHGGGSSEVDLSGYVQTKTLKSLLKLLGIGWDHYDTEKGLNPVTASPIVGMTTGPVAKAVPGSHFSWTSSPDDPGTVLARILKLEKAVNTAVPSGFGVADPRIDQLLEWAKHIDQVLKAASTSDVLAVKA